VPNLYIIPEAPLGTVQAEAPEIVFRPSLETIKRTRIWRFMEANGISSYDELIRRSTEDLEWYWDAVDRDLGLRWFRRYDHVLDLSRGIPWARWFTGGKCNITQSCMDRWVDEGKGSRRAFLWEGEDGTTKELTYAQMLASTNKIANGLKGLGFRKGDVVGVYMPMIPEALSTLLACSRIGAIHAVVFSGFSPPALAARLRDSGAKFLVTCDGYYRRGKLVELKKQADAALDASPGVTKSVIARYAKNEVELKTGRDLWLDDVAAGQPDSCEPEVMDAEDPLYILYTSGTTGKPKGSVHVHGGYAAYAGQQTAYLIDVGPGDVLFWPADIGWITGQTWTLYGNLIAGGTALVYDGAFDYPRQDRWWDLIERHRVTVFGTSPTGLRVLMKQGEEGPRSHDLSKVRILAATGEPLNPSEWNWFFRVVGGSKAPLINLTGGTEVGGAFVSPLPIMPLKVSTVGGPVPGLAVDVVDEEGKPVRQVDGYLVVRKPWPGMTRGIWGDPERYIAAYWSRFKDVWFHGDWAMIDRDGYWYLHGRVDDVIKISGYRMGSAEVESILEGHPSVQEAAAIGMPHEVKGEGLAIVVVVRKGFAPSEALRAELKDYVSSQLGKIFRPDDVRFVTELPKTRTGKIVRRVIRAKLLGEEVGDLSTLDNPSSVDALADAR
jgi:acetyl-CoA synthetase